MSASVQRKLQQAHDRLQRGEIAAAAALCEDVLTRAPRNPDALWLLASARLIEGRAADAVPLLERALAAVPSHGAVLESLGLAHLMLAQYGDAERVLRKALAVPGAPASVRMRLGIALLHQNEHAAAITELERVAALEPRNLDARLSLGQAHARADSWAAAAREFEQALALDAGHMDALYNLGVASMELGDAEKARACFDRVLARDPSYAEARERLAATYLSVGRYVEALGHLEDLVRARPAEAPAHATLANAYFQLGRLDEARAAAEIALDLDPAATGSYSMLALIQHIRGELDGAVSTLEEGYARTGADLLLGSLVHLLHRLCDWEKWQSAWNRLEPRLAATSDAGSPFWLLCEATTAEQQLAYTRRWAAARFANVRAAAIERGSRLNRRLRVGYFSPDFHEHATAYLLTEVLELHDRERFEIFAYSYGPEDRSPMRARIRSAVEHFVDVAWEPHDAVVKRMARDELDVLVDLKGYLVGDRLEIMARRPAAVQVAWLGYPGTTGADFIDYLIADNYILPREAEAFYSEKILRMPYCYQPNDRRRPRGEPLAREEYGLPREGFVFCCFNQTVKIVPNVFARWMSLLRRVPGSVLWLLEDNRWASANLKRAAFEHGIANERIVVGARLPLAEHLARYAVADLALDTFPYTSHTTASDALWMGCPLVALRGETFAARVSASVLANCGLPDLVTDTLDGYEALAYTLATDAAYMREIRARLAAARETAPLFDSQRFTQDLEALYVQIAR